MGHGTVRVLETQDIKTCFQRIFSCDGKPEKVWERASYVTLYSWSLVRCAQQLISTSITWRFGLDWVKSANQWKVWNDLLCSSQGTFLMAGTKGVIECHNSWQPYVTSWESTCWWGTSANFCNRKYKECWKYNTEALSFVLLGRKSPHT